MSQLPDTLSYLDLGGTKSDYTPVVDTSTDRSATEVNLAFAATASMSRTSIRTWVKIGVSVAGALTLLNWDACWKGGTVAAPVLTTVSGGKYLITFPTTVLDEQATSHNLNLKTAWITYCADTDTPSNDAYRMETIVLTANTIRIWCIVGADEPITPVNTILTVYAI